jgi:glutamate/tyrosine decarboxylase-like PLP-dependent enzyme
MKRPTHDSADEARSPGANATASATPSPDDVEEFRAVGHQIIDRLAQYMESVSEQPLFPEVDAKALDELFDEPIPTAPSEPNDVLAELESKLFPFCTHVSHPGYFGLITPSPSPIGALADLIASTLNQNIGAYSIGPSGVALERRVLRWLNDLVGFGAEASGNLTSGGMMANFIGLKLARDASSGDQAQHRGVGRPYAVYASEERHVSVDKAVDAVGLGREQLRVLPTDDSFSLDLDALERAIAADKARGITPACVVGIAGTTNTGAIDPLAELRRIADREGMWLHVDAAYGGGMFLSKRYPGLSGIELADSVTIDPHKWFFAPLDVGAVLVRDRRKLESSFGLLPPYLADNRDPEGTRYQFHVHGFEQSRRLRGLKVWMSLKRYGTNVIGDWVDRNVDQAKRLHDLAEESPDFRSAVAPKMSAVCLRFQPNEWDANEESLERVHKEVAGRVEESGRFWISTTLLKKVWWFRICPVNFRTRMEHVEELFEVLRRECRAVMAGN